MTVRATATSIQNCLSKDMTRVLDATAENGDAVEVVIPSQMFAPLAETTQAFLLHSLAIAQRMGGTAILEASQLRVRRRENKSVLLLSTDALGTVGLRLTPKQWVELAEIANAAKDASQIQ